jgi:hypothetical protein
MTLCQHITTMAVPMPRVLLVLPLLCGAASAQPDTVVFVQVPRWGLSDSLKGRVQYVNPTAYKIALFIFVEEAGGWYTKPTRRDSLTHIDPATGTWRTSITTGGIDQYATRIIAFLVPNGTAVQVCEPCSTLPPVLFRNAYAITCRPHGSRRITFSGFNWIVKRTVTDSIGPGPNFFSDDPADVWTDGLGLHLSIVRRNNRWYCSEVIADTVLGYGTYAFRVRTNVDTLDANTVLGLFTWDDCAPFVRTNASSTFRELDIEFSRWGNAASDTNAQFVVQPVLDTNRHRFVFHPSDTSFSKFVWDSTRVEFVSRAANTAHAWTYNGNFIPKKGNENARINFWLFNSQSPLNGRRAEAIIQSFARIATGLKGPSGAIPREFQHHQNFPNPFNPTTRIEYAIPKTSHVSLKVFDVLGREVATLVNERLQPGSY